MIPRILELKNFLSYGETLQEIDFKDYSLICLSGKNGHGKSALLDAITWSLWGQARKITGASKADEGLMRLGQSRMMVSLTFDLGPARYRVRRELTKTLGKSHAALDFELFDTTNNRYISLTDKTIRITQAKIDQVVGLDFETFINSAFLRQGQSNEFSKKSSKERKQILATILGLSKYDKLQHQALEKAKILTEEKKGNLAILDQYAQELAKEPELLEQLAQEKNRLAELTAQLQTIESTRREHEKNLLVCQNQKLALDALAQEQLVKEQRYSIGIEHIRALRSAWKEAHRNALALPDITSLQAEKSALLKQEQQLLELQRTQITLQEKILLAHDSKQKRLIIIKDQWDQKLNAQRIILQKQQLEAKHQQSIIASSKSSISSLTAKLENLIKEKIARENSIAQDALSIAQLSPLKARFEKGRALYQSLVQRGNWAKTALTDLERKQTIIDDHNNPSCPLCEQLLTAKRKQFLAQQLSHDEKFLKHRFTRISLLLKSLKDLLVVQHDQIKILEKQSQDQAAHTLHSLELGRVIEQITSEITIGNSALQTLLHSQDLLEKTISQSESSLIRDAQKAQEELASDDQIQQISAMIAQLEQEKTASIWDPQAAQQLQEKMALLDHAITHYESIKQDVGRQQERKLALASQCAALKELKASLTDISTKLAQLPAIIAQESELKQQIAQVSQQAAHASTQKEHLLHVIGSQEYAINRLIKLKAATAQRNQALVKLDLEIDDYQALALALSKNGIQALLIEEVIPEIEHEANALLSRLTSNQAQIFIESLRDLKNGGVKETLDIQIADSAGIRPYEMYSGGEAFRVDFALRIAISKLLARRAGTALQTLIIDEGFGSQDEDGLANIMEALYAIQADFSKIIIVSHLPEFKHNFPVHFIAEKGPSGTMITVEERG